MKKKLYLLALLMSNGKASLNFNIFGNKFPLVYARLTYVILV